MVAILSWLGFRGRLDALERRTTTAADLAASVHAAEQARQIAGTVTRDTCNAVHRGVADSMDALQRSIDAFREDSDKRLGRIENRVDEIYRNGKGVGGAS